jgi:hypothetical protein
VSATGPSRRSSLNASFCFLAVVSVTWALYGYVIADNFVHVPNAVGALLALCQLLLFVK